MYLKEAKTGPFKVFGDTFRKHPELLLTNRLKSISTVVQQNCVYPAVIKYKIGYF